MVHAALCTQLCEHCFNPPSWAFRDVNTVYIRLTPYVLNSKTVFNTQCEYKYEQLQSHINNSVYPLQVSIMEYCQRQILISFPEKYTLPEVRQKAIVSYRNS